ncbi:MAG: nucleotide pyrophosphohydrolase [Nitrospira sp.]|nr:nucleotide pyrophosphohydrolase [Nitrospira sp.]MCW5796533.1 nucleotide pyrophosphohydrolase [Nitrospira sp.]HMU30876.1 nucleotide pyrophosphohydrolase [Nitrospira sp.]HMV57928.1 nucleotide pyrophosphohydrolase [Nitrospira sp.]HMW86843.1 nucleotide pyrophosphohydrolase [Nitrospira sp.]
MLNAEVMAEVLEFRRKRDWEQFHKPKELAAAITVEASELLEVFQWKTHEEVARLLGGPSRERVTDEIADVVILLSYLCHDLGLDVNEAVRAKLKKNEAKYPVEKSYGNARKYDE